MPARLRPAAQPPGPSAVCRARSATVMRAACPAWSGNRHEPPVGPGDGIPDEPSTKDRAMSVAHSSHPLPVGLPAWLGPTHRRVCALVDRLPVAPPSFVLAQVLDRVLLPRLPADARQALMLRCV